MSITFSALPALQLHFCGHFSTAVHSADIAETGHVSTVLMAVSSSSLLVSRSARGSSAGLMERARSLMPHQRGLRHSPGVWVVSSIALAESCQECGKCFLDRPCPHQVML